MHLKVSKKNNNSFIFLEFHLTVVSIDFYSETKMVLDDIEQQLSVESFCYTPM